MPLSEELFAFLSDLSANNNREWFAHHKHRYERHVKAPLIDLINAFALPLQGISPHYRAVPKVGGSLFRIYRDIRFSKDKRPYKTHAGVHFRHEAGKGAHAPGFYLHLEPNACFAAAGIWGPDTRTLTMIRTAIDREAKRWKSVKQQTQETFSLDHHGERLKRTPRGFPADHPMAEDLRRKHFVASKALADEDVLGPHFLDQLSATCRAGAPFMAFLTKALGLPW